MPEIKYHMPIKEECIYTWIKITILSTHGQ